MQRPPRLPTKASRASLLVVLVGGALALGVLFCINPVTIGWLPPCLLHKLTGLHCPGCGVTRAVHHLLHGELLAALRLNLLFTLLAPTLGSVALWCWCRGRPMPWPPAASWWLLGVVLVFGLLRNLPLAACQWLAP